MSQPHQSDPIVPTSPTVAHALREVDLFDAAWRPLQPLDPPSSQLSATPEAMRPISAGSTIAEPPATHAPERRPEISGYMFISEIHRGGQGVVYHAVHESTQRDVAVKVLHRAGAARPRDRHRFELEVQVLRELNHPNIVTVLDMGEIDGRQFLVMPFVESQPLDRHVAEAGLNVRQTLELFAHICDAVAAAHLAGVIHRDIKPGNILIDDADTPFVVDFGLAKLDGAAGAAGTGIPSGSPFGTANWNLPTATLTETGQFIGSLPWASPEQADPSLGRVDVRTDVYSLGAVLYCLLTGRYPIDPSGSHREVLNRIVTVPPIPLRSALRPSVSSSLRPCSMIDRDVEIVVHKCLEKEPARRYQSAGDLAAEIRRYLAGKPIEARRDSALYVLRKALHHYRIPVAIAALFLLLILCATVVSTAFWQRAERQADQARRERDRAESFAQFMEDTFDGVAPAVARGRDTAMLREMLDDAAKRVAAGEYSELPETELRMRLTIGEVYRNLVEYSAALSMLEPARELARRAYGDESIQVAETLCAIANVLHNQSRSHEALELAQASLDLCERLKLGDDLVHLLALKNVVGSLRDLGRIQDAFPLTDTVLSMCRSVFPGDHLMTAEALLNRGYCLQRLDRPSKALPFYEEAYAMSRRANGEERPHPHFVKCLSILGECHAWLGCPDEAVRCYEQALGFCRQLYPGPHRETAHTLHLFGEALRRLGRLEEAEAYQNEAVQSGRAHPEWGQFDVRINSEFWLARVLMDAGRPDDAVASLRECTSTLTRQFPDNLLFQLAGWHVLAWALLEQAGDGAAAEAEELMRRSLPICEERLPESAPYHWLRFDAMRLLGAALAAQARFAEAEPHLLAAYSGFGQNDYTLPRRAHIGIDFKRDTAERIVALYRRWHAAQPNAAHDRQASAWEKQISDTPLRPLGVEP